MELSHVKTNEEPKMKYIVEVNNMDGEYRHLEYDSEEKAFHEFHWYSTYTNADSVEMKAVRE